MVYDPYADAINQGAHEQYPPAVKYPAPAEGSREDIFDGEKDLSFIRGMLRI